MTANTWLWLSPLGGSFSSAGNWGTVVGDSLVNGVPGPDDVGTDVQGAITGSGTIGFLEVIGAASFTGVITADEISAQADITTQGTLTTTDEFLITTGNSLTASGSAILNGPSVATTSGPFGNAGFEDFGVVTMSGFTELNAYTVDDFGVLQVNGGIISATTLSVGSTTAEASMTLGAAAVATDTVGAANGLGSSAGSGSVTINGGTWENQELIVGGVGPGSLVMNSGATVTATGPFEVFAGAPALGVGVESAAGNIAIDGGSVLTVTGVADIAANGSVSLGGGTLSASGSVSIAGSLSGNGSVLAPVTVDGAVTASGGTLIVQGLVGGTGVLTIDAATLDLQAGIASGPTVDFAAGSLLLDTPGAAGATMADFGTGDTIVLTGVVANSGTFAGGILTLRNGGAAQGTLAFAGSYNSNDFRVTAGSGKTTVTYAPCFAAGTRLLTARGEVAVQALAPGDVVPTASGRMRPVRWIGHRRIEPARHPRRHDVDPVRVLADAFAPGVPHRDLWLSPDHAVFAGGVLIPIRYLINGATIRQQETAEITYYHVELDAHDVVLADGLAAESYLDTGNRAAFENGGNIVVAHADFSRSVWQERGCAPLVTAGPVLAAARKKILARARALGFALTTDPDLRLIVDSEMVRPRVEGTTYRFTLPDGAREVRLVSRSVVPASVVAGSSDHRRLGVAVAGLRIDGEAVTADDPRRAGGWHAAEPEWQWTNGDAGLACSGARRVEVTLALLPPYWDSGAMPRGDDDRGTVMKN